MELNEDQAGYRWETAYADGLNLNEVLQEDESGSVEKSVAKIILDERAKKRLRDRPSKVRLGIIRYVYLIVDCSASMTDKSLQPSRIKVVSKALHKFVEKFSEHNPLSQLGIITCKDKRADRIVQLTGNIRLVKEGLATLNEANCSGEFSLYNGLYHAINSLRNFAGHASREIILIISSMSTCDPVNIFSTFELLKRYNIRSSVIGIGAEVFVYKKLCAIASGTYSVIVDKSHFENILNDFTPPPVVTKTIESGVVKMGFPFHEKITKPSFCLCHQSDSRPARSRGFFCPQCGAKYCSLPVECRVCKLTLISAPQLARSYLHLVPLPAFKEVESAQETCYGCAVTLSVKSYACKTCSALFCIECDLLLHESLQICPSCA